MKSPTPDADPSIVRHVLYLDGPGRETPYLSTTESALVAQRFAGQRGRVWRTTVSMARRLGVAHISQVELKRLLRGKGQGAGKWKSALEVMQAQKYVQQWQEHLLDFRHLDHLTDDALDNTVQELFEAD